jgi:hypothetical protein
MEHLEGYKVLALNTAPSTLFPPYEFYMEAKNRPTL